MRQRLIAFILTLGLLISPLLAVPVRAIDPAATRNAVCEGITVGSSAGCDTPGPSLNDTITTGINIFSVIIAIIAVVMIIVGGLKYIISSGDSANVTSAKNTILYAIIGLVVVAMAQLIVKFVLKRVGG